MRHVLALCLTVALASSASASVNWYDHHQLSPVPEVPAAVHGHTVHMHGAAAPVALFPHVKYKDKHEMAPCAVPKIIRVKDPCACDDCCSCCGPKCVYIQICVPPCACERVKSNKSGTRVEYDYGDYEVDVRVKDGYIEVDYQD